MPELLNPFANYGPLVYGERFIGRTQALGQIWRRVVDSGGSLSIIGERRVGKSSLAYQALFANDDLRKQQIFPIWIDMATYPDPARFFTGLVRWCAWELEDHGRLPRPVRETAEELQRDGQRFDYDRVQFFFQQVQRQGLRLVIVLDEFDQSRELFRQDGLGFHQLRALNYRQQVTFVTVSRRTIHDLEQQTGAVVPFAQVFEPCYVGMFADDEVELLLGKISALGVPLTAEDCAELRARCGAHPFLLSMVASGLIEQYRLAGRLDRKQIFAHTEPEFMRHYADIAERLEAEGWLPLIGALLAGEPIGDGSAPPELLQSTLLSVNSRGQYIPFSPHFGSYLEQICAPTDGTLTERELAVLRLAAVGQQNREIGRALIIGEDAVKFHLRNIFRKLRVKNRQAAATRARELQLIP